MTLKTWVMWSRRLADQSDVGKLLSLYFASCALGWLVDKSKNSA